MNRTARFVGIGSLAVLSLAIGDAGAQGVQVQPEVYKATRGGSPPPKYNLPPQPALPAGCAAPTKDQCGDSNWYKADACASDAAKAKAMQDYCVWVLQKAWVDTQSTQHQTLFPTSPPSTPNPVLTPGRLDQYGKSVNAVKMTRPGDKRRYPTGGRGTTTPANGPATLSWTPTTMRAGGGSYAGLHTQSVVPQLAAVHRRLEPFRQTGATDVALRGNLPALLTQLQQKPSFVITPGPGVSSCEEYAYKRWGEWSDFSNAAKKLGTNYRQVFKQATDPSSPFFINKKILTQTGTTTRIPVQIYQQRQHPYWFGTYQPTGTDSIGQNVSDSYVYDWVSDDEKWLPANPFVTHKPYWLIDPKATTQNNKALLTDAQRAQINQLIDAQWLPQYGSPRRVQAKNPTTPLAVHVEMKRLFDTKYSDPLDDEMADADKRTGAYQDLLGKADSLRISLACAQASDPCFRCSSPPSAPSAGLPGSIQKLKDKLTGAPVINPGDIAGILQSGSPAARASALRAMSKIGNGYADIYGGSRGQTLGGVKQKPNVLADVDKRQPPINSDPVAQCKAKLEAQRPAIEDAYYAVTQQLTKLLVNELQFGDRGCLANPGSDIGNLCDWSYAKFAAFATTLFDDEVESDFQQCRSEINTASAALNPKPTGNLFTQILKDPRNQALAFPCTQRRDFTGNAPDANWFFRLSGNYIGRYCEAARVDISIADQQNAIVDQLSGIRFKEGELYDTTADDNTLGDKDSLGAYFNYDANWSMKKTGVYKDQDPMKACRYDSAGGTNIKTGIYFFGDDIELFNLNSQGQSAPKPGGPNTPTVTMNARYLDIDTFKTKEIASVQDKSVPAGQDYSVPLVDPPYNLGGIEYGFWIQVGPVPLHIKFGATATAGIDYHFAAQTGDNCNVPWQNAAPTKPSGFKIVSEVDPWVRADAYADASVDIVIAAAGVRLDLELLKLGLPIGVNVKSDNMNFDFKNGMSVTIDMLSGKLSAYAEVGVGPLSAEYDVTIFSWDGFHTDIPLWGLNKQLGENVVRVALASYIDPGQVKCACDAQKCCSNLSCQIQSACGDQTKLVNNEQKICTFNAKDFNEMWTTTNPHVAKMRTTDMLQCQWFIK